MTATSRWLRENWKVIVAFSFICIFGIVLAVKLYQATQWEFLKTWNASYEIGEGAWTADIVAEWEADIVMGPVSEAEADILIDFFVHARKDLHNEEWIRTTITCSRGQFVERVA